MPIGQVLTIPNGQSVLVTTLSREQKASIAMLNPNDGVIYVKLNGPAQISPTIWDWKVPSQSYCQLPGPWQSIGVAYQDQSGAGGTATVNVYESDSDIAIPSFIAIGRALQSAGTTVDITTGTIPQNPPAGTARLWVDSTGALHILQSNGTDVTDLNTSNYNTIIAVIGDVIGPLNNTTISMRNASWAMAHDASGNLVNFFTIWSDNNIYFNLPANAGNFTFRAQNNTLLAQIASPSQIRSASVYATAGYLHTTDGSNGIVYSDNGNLYFRSASTNYVFDSGGVMQISGGVAGSSYITCTGGLGAYGGILYFRNDNGVYWQWNVSGTLYTNVDIASYASLFLGNQQGTANHIYWEGSATSGGSINVGSYYVYPGLSVGGRIQAMTAWVGVNTVNANAILAPNIGDNRGQGLAFSWNTWASVDHARQYGLKNAPVTDPLSLVNAISGYYYAHTSMKGNEPILRETGEVESFMTYGFAASEVNLYIPELATEEYVDTSRMLAILWEAVKELDARTRVA